MVSWNEAAEMNDSVAKRRLRDSQQYRVDRKRFLALTASSCSETSMESGLVDLLTAQGTSSFHLAVATCTLRSICRMMTSMCLSLIFTPCRR